MKNLTKQQKTILIEKMKSYPAYLRQCEYFSLENEQRAIQDSINYCIDIINKEII